MPESARAENAAMVAASRSSTSTMLALWFPDGGSSNDPNNVRKAPLVQAASRSS